MGIARASAFLALLLLTGAAWGAVTFSRETIECCNQWLSVATVTKANGEPYPQCKILVTVMETRGGIETTLAQSIYYTNSSGNAVISYKPNRLGERLKISVACGENLKETLIPVSGTTDGSGDLGMGFELPPIEISQVLVVAFLIFAVIFLVSWNRIKKVFGKAVPKGPAKKEGADDEGMSPRRLILDHERKVAAKLAKKHRRKEIRLGHEFVRKL